MILVSIAKTVTTTFLRQSVRGVSPPVNRQFSLRQPRRFLAVLRLDGSLQRFSTSMIARAGRPDNTHCRVGLNDNPGRRPVVTLTELQDQRSKEAPQPTFDHKSKIRYDRAVTTSRHASCSCCSYIPIGQLADREFQSVFRSASRKNFRKVR